MDNYGKEELSDQYYEQMRGLPEKAATTIRFFDRDGQITVYNSDAHLLAQNFFKSNGVLKQWGQSVYINLSLNNFESVLKETLLSWHYRYVSKTRYYDDKSKSSRSESKNVCFWHNVFRISFMSLK